MPNLIHGLDPGGGLRPIQVDDNGNLSVDLVSGVSVSTSITGTMTVQQLSGSADSVSIVSNIASLDVVQVSGSTFSIATGPTSLDVQQVSGSAWSVSVTGSSASIVVVGTVVADAADVGDAPVKGGGIARTTNPTAVADNDVVSSAHDDLGRQVMVPHQVRDLIQTSYAAITTGTEATLQAAGGSGVFLDLIQVVCANTSDGTVQMDFRDATAGGIVFSVQCPASGTAGFVPAVPYPQNVANLPWTADMNDVSNTTVNISALFIKNV